LLLTAGAFAVQKGQTALLLAARQNQPEAVSALLKAGARVDAQDSQGNTPLHEAARSNHVDVMQVRNASCL